jgi:hypothetical protein
LTAEYILRNTNLSVVMPVWRFGPTSGHGWMMADLFGYVAIILVESDVFKRLALGGMG